MSHRWVRTLVGAGLVSWGTCLFVACRGAEPARVPSGPGPEYESPPARIVDSRHAGAASDDIEALIDDASEDPGASDAVGAAGAAATAPPVPASPDAGAPPP